MKLHRLAIAAAMAGSLALSGVAHAQVGGIGDVTGGLVDITDEGVSVGSGLLDDSLVEAEGNNVNANAAVCANVISAGAVCRSSATQKVTTNVGGGSDDALVSVNGNNVNLNTAVCANVLSADAECVSKANQTVKTNIGGKGGGSLAPIGGGTLPKTGSSLLFLLTFGGSMLASVGTAFRQRYAEAQA